MVSSEVAGCVCVCGRGSRLAVLGGDTTSVSPEALSPNGWSAWGGEHPWSLREDSATEEERLNERHRQRSGRGRGVSRRQAWQSVRRRDRTGREVELQKNGMGKSCRTAGFHQYSFTCLYGTLATVSACGVRTTQLKAADTRIKKQKHHVFWIQESTKWHMLLSVLLMIAVKNSLSRQLNTDRDV